MPFTSTDDEKILQYLGLDGDRPALSNVQSRMFAVRSLGEPVIKACQDSLSKIEAIDKALTDAVKTPKSISSEDFEELRKEGRRACNWLANILGLDVGADYFGSFEAGQLALIPNSAKGVANGVATLDSSGLIPLIQVPPIDGLWGTINGELSDQTDLQDALDARATNLALSAHTNATNNPHQVTLAQIGGPIIQQTQPSNPTDGMRWLEVDGSGFPVQEWYWDSTVNGGSWLSTNLFSSFGFTGSMTTLANRCTGTQISLPSYATHWRVDGKVDLYMTPTVALTSTDYLPIRLFQSQGTFNSGISANSLTRSDLFANTNHNFTAAYPSAAANNSYYYNVSCTTLSIDSSYTGIGVSAGAAVGSPGTYSVQFCFNYRLVR